MSSIIISESIFVPFSKNETFSVLNTKLSKDCIFLKKTFQLTNRRIFEGSRWISDSNTLEIWIEEIILGSKVHLIVNIDNNNNNIKLKYVRKNMLKTLFGLKKQIELRLK